MTAQFSCGPLKFCGGRSLSLGLTACISLNVFFKAALSRQGVDEYPEISYCFHSDDMLEHSRTYYLALAGPVSGGAFSLVSPDFSESVGCDWSYRIFYDSCSG